MSDRDTDKRAHPRKALTCRICLFSRGGDAIATGQTLNVSEGGVFLRVPRDLAGEIGPKINVAISVPRATPNTYMLEDFASSASVVRRDDRQDAAHLAVRFDKPLDLGLCV